MKKVVSPDEHLFTGRVEFQGYVKFGTVRVIIDELGRVGIGTINPQGLLHISDSYVAATPYVASHLIIEADSETYIEFLADAGEVATQGILWSDGTTGIGGIRYTHSTDKMRFDVGGNAEAVVIDSSGNVGIGTVTPTLPLDVKAKSGHSATGGFCIKLTNKTGGNTVAGELVKVYTATAIDDAFATQDANGDNTIGVVLEAGKSDGSEAWIVVSGIADVLMDSGGSARGDRIISSATAGSGDVWNVGGAVATHFLEIGHCIETRTGAGLARCVLHFN